MRFTSTTLIRSGIILGIIGLILVSSLFGDDEVKARVAVVRFSNDTGSPSYDAACKAATDTLTMTLRQLGRYQVQSFDEANSTAEGLRTMAEAQQLDFIMYGTISQKAGTGLPVGFPSLIAPKERQRFHGRTKRQEYWTSLMWPMISWYLSLNR